MRGTDMSNIEIKEKAEGARIRSNIYGFLSSMFREEISAERLQQIKGPAIKEVLSEMGLQYDIFSQKDQDKLLEDLAVEYARLFLGPDKHISPHEAVHHQRDDGDWGYTGAVQQLMSKSSLRPPVLNISRNIPECLTISALNLTL